MTKILIGSHAARHWFPDFPREPGDYDYICPDKSLKCKEIDIHWNNAFEIAAAKYPGDIAPPILLHTLKVSHAFWSHWWEKTMFDTVFFYKKGVPIDDELFPILYAAWEKQFGAKKVCLDEDNDDFFNDKVRRKYVHDDIHAAVAYLDEPLYLKIKKDRSKAMVSRAMFEALPYDHKLKLCLEEMSVIALERYLIPNNFRIHWKSALQSAGKDLVIRMSKGWWPKFIIQNWTELFVNNRDNSFIHKFKTKLQEGKIRTCN